MKQPILFVAVGVEFRPGTDDFVTHPPSNPPISLALLKHGVKFRQPVSTDGWNPSRSWGIWGDELTLKFTGRKGGGVTIPFGSRNAPDQALIRALEKSDLPKREHPWE